jgi:hypothetical protein
MGEKERIKRTKNEEMKSRGWHAYNWAWMLFRGLAIQCPRTTAQAAARCCKAWAL